MRISGIEPSSTILSQTKELKKLKSDAKPFCRKRWVFASCQISGKPISNCRGEVKKLSVNQGPCLLTDRSKYNLKRGLYASASCQAVTSVQLLQRRSRKGSSQSIASMVIFIDPKKYNSVEDIGYRLLVKIWQKFDQLFKRIS